MSTTRATIDEALGPGDTRYFGQGFQRVAHHLTDITIRCDRITGTVSATASVDYPPDWSTKTAQPADPHLSTVDALVIAAQLAEAYLTHAHGLDPAARTRMWLRAFIMKAGAAAQTHLAGFAVEGRRTGMRIGPWGTNMLISSFDLRIGTLQLSCQVQHDIGLPVRTGATWPDIERLLGSAVHRQYGSRFTHRRHDISDVVVDISAQTAQAQVQVDDTSDVSMTGLAASYEPALSMVDATVCMAQLAQVLAYQLEEIDRDETDTLWMRGFGMRSDTASVPITDVIAMSARVVRRRRVDRMRRSWRLYQMDGAIGAIQAVASLAFNVPGAVTAATHRNGVQR